MSPNRTFAKIAKIQKHYRYKIVSVIFQNEDILKIVFLAHVIKLFTLINESTVLQLDVLVTVSKFCPSLIFAVSIGPYP